MPAGDATTPGRPPDPSRRARTRRAPDPPSQRLEEGPARGAPEKKQRDPFLDNARGILIALVVIGHALQSADSTDGYVGGAIDTWIYAFHMPAFIMISGYLSHSYRNEPRQIRRLLTSMVVPYLLLQVIHEVMRMIFLGDEFDPHLFEASWTTWFLLALIAWRLLTPVLRILRYPLVLAVAASVLGPLDADLSSTFTLGRILGFLPFFVLGLIATPEMLERVKAFRPRILAAVVLVAGLVLSFVTHEHFTSTIFHMSGSYADADLSNLRGVVIRVMVLLVGLVASLCVLVLTPRGQHWISQLGLQSLTVYVLHPIVLMPLRYTADPEWATTTVGTLAITAGAVLLTALLAHPWIVRAGSWLTDPPIGHLLVREDPTRPGRRGAG